MHRWVENTQQVKGLGCFSPSKLISCNIRHDSCTREGLIFKTNPTTYMYFLEPLVCSCRATEKPKKLPLVLPSLITGKRSSKLNPLQVRVPRCAHSSAQRSAGSRGNIMSAASCPPGPRSARRQRQREIQQVAALLRSHFPH